MAGSSTCRRGFTMIEMLISIALGAAICAAAFAAFRVASQSVAAANRLAIENALFRAGYHAALDDLDSWNSLDDPARPAAQRPLNVPGQPFGPLTFAADELDFDLSDPRLWWRGHAMEHRTTKLGDYAQLANLGMPASDPRAWHPRILDRLSAQLGFYGVADHLPANTVYSFYEADGSIPPIVDHPVYGFMDDSGVGHDFAHYWSFTGRALDLQSMTHFNYYVVTADLAYRDAAHHVFTNYGVTSKFRWSSDRIHTDCIQSLPVLSLAPAHWPSLQVETKHWIAFAHFIDEAVIRVTSPGTGQVMRVNVVATATTLRGARRQRGLETVSP